MEAKAQMEFERKLKVGDECTAYWTNCGNWYQTQVEVEAVNAKSFRVRIIRAIDDYPVGHKLNIPNFLNWKRWTWNNRLAPPPVDHYQEHLEAGVMPGNLRG